MTGVSDTRSSIQIYNCTVEKADGGNYGILKDVTLEFEPSFAGRDYMGRPQVNGYFCRAFWTMMQNDQDALNLMSDDINADTAETVTINGMPSGPNAASISLTNMKPYYVPKMDGAGNLSLIEVTAERIYSLADFVTLFNKVS